jgi:hypothetical protein
VTSRFGTASSPGITEHRRVVHPSGEASGILSQVGGPLGDGLIGGVARHRDDPAPGRMRGRPAKRRIVTI